MEQMIGTTPYRYEVVGESEARIVEHRRRGLFGQWGTPQDPHPLGSLPGRGGHRGNLGRGGGQLWRRADLQGDGQGRSRSDHPSPPGDPAAHRRCFGSPNVYRDRRIPPGPVTLVASWAGMPYRLFTEPRRDAPRGREILTATEVEALPERSGQFVKVRVAGGDEGWVESDQIVPSPAVSTRAAQVETARFT